MIPGILRTVNKINAEEKVRKQCEINKEQLVEIQAVFCRYFLLKMNKFNENYMTVKAFAV